MTAKQVAEITVHPQDLESEAVHRELVATKLGISPLRIGGMTLERRSLDSRRGQPRFNLRFGVWIDSTPQPEPVETPAWRDVSCSEPIVIVGAGPAGLFCALRAIELNLKPIVLERGRTVRDRRFDLARITKGGTVDSDSNYCFGEGGAGTYSDGKLYTRSTKRGSVRRILERLVHHGASPEILIDAHPHIGTNKLPKVVEAIRETIRAHGGEVRFEMRVDRLFRSSTGIAGVGCANGNRIDAKAVVIATGHSARDIFELFVREGLRVEAKPLAVGVRIEHPQSLIDAAQYRGMDSGAGSPARHPNLPAAAYDLSCQVENRGVYSFCMCPGGIICPAATAPGEVVTNGWSPSKRNSYFANSGLVVSTELEDFGPYRSHGPLMGVEFQRSIERKAYDLGGGANVAPAQRLADLLEGRVSASLPRCSYLPGLRSVPLSEVLPPGIYERLAVAVRRFGSQMKGFLHEDGIAVGVETRTSSPVRIPRDSHTLIHPDLQGLIPCGEGAGYAGGIVSAAIDGERCADAAARFFHP